MRADLRVVPMPSINKMHLDGMEGSGTDDNKILEAFVNNFITVCCMTKILNMEATKKCTHVCTLSCFLLKIGSVLGKKQFSHISLKKKLTKESVSGEISVSSSCNMLHSSMLFN